MTKNNYKIYFQTILDKLATLRQNRPRPNNDEINLAEQKRDLLENAWNTSFDQKCSLEDVYYCFRLLLGRPPAKQEWHSHSCFAGGQLEDVVSVYLNSREFKNRRLGIFETEHITLMDIHDFKLYVPLNDQLVGKTISNAKTYEPHITEFIRSYLKPGQSFVDIGANIGYFSMFAASLVRQEGRVYAFEPSSFNVKLLHLSKIVNDFHNIDIFPLAVSNKRDLYLYDSGGTNGVISPMTNDLRSIFESTLIYSTTLDETLKGKIHFIKIDIEGAEYLALSGGKNILDRDCPIIVSEFSPASLTAISNISPVKYLELLLINPTYSLFAFEEYKIIPCSQDLEKVMSIYRQKNSDHIDIIAAPASSCLQP